MSWTVALMRGLRFRILELGAGWKAVILGAVLACGLGGGVGPGSGLAVGSDCQVGLRSVAGLSVIWLVFAPPVELIVQMLGLAAPTALSNAILVPSGE